MAAMRAQARRDCIHRFGTGAFYSRLRLTVLGFLLCLLSYPGTDAQRNEKNVVVLSGGRGRASINIMESSLRAHVPWAVNFSVVDLENPRLEEEPYRESLAATLRSAYGEKPDLVVAVMDPSLRFATQYRDKMFPGVPIVFMSVSNLLADQKTWQGVTGVATAAGIRETIDLALRLHPDTNSIAVIAGVSDTEKDYLVAVQADLARRRDKVHEIDVVGQPSARMLKDIAALPPHTVVLFQLFPHDSEQPAIGAFDVLGKVAQRLPTYSIFPSLAFDHGGIGGASTDPARDAALAGEIGARVLSGEKPDNIPIVHLADFQVRVDMRQLRRWNIPESALPPGTLVLNRKATFWERNRKYLLSAIIIILIQSLLIAGLLWQRKRKRKAESVLHESEERFKRLADTTLSLIWVCDAQARITYLNDRRVIFTGPDPQAGYGNTWITYVHPDDLPGILDAAAQAFKTRQPFSGQYRLRRSDGAYRWMFGVASQRTDSSGSFAGFIGSAIDITDQKLAREALEKVSGQLIEAQEKERRRIARELHDDICQRLAFLSLELDHAHRDPVISARHLEEIRKHCSEIADDVQRLSHQLHSSKLDYLGIVAALRGFANEFSQRHDVRVEFTEMSVPQNVPHDVALCLFRVAQEALHNAMKHSRTSRFAVRLTGTEGEVQLEVRDWGEGFDVEEAKQSRGLGLLSMQERVNLVHGKFTIDSSPGQGTRIFVAVPLPERSGAVPGGNIANETAAGTEKV